MFYLKSSNSDVMFVCLPLPWFLKNNLSLGMNSLGYVKFAKILAQETSVSFYAELSQLFLFV
jgi:hypothetical protein